MSERELSKSLSPTSFHYGGSLFRRFVYLMDSFIPKICICNGFFLFAFWCLMAMLLAKIEVSNEFLHLDLDLWWWCFSPWSKFLMGFLHLYLVLWWLWLCLLLFLSLFVMMCFSSWLEQIWRTPSRRSISMDDPSVYQLVNPTTVKRWLMGQVARGTIRVWHKFVQYGTTRTRVNKARSTARHARGSDWV